MTVQKLLAVAVAAVGLSTSAWAAPKLTDKDLTKQAEHTLDTFTKADPALSMTLTESAGYAMFPNVAKGALGIGGAAGTGVLFEKGKAVGKVSMTQLTIGLAAGGQSFSELIVFENPAVLDNFKTGTFAFAAQTSAVASKSGAALAAPYVGGVKVFSKVKSGLMFEAAIGGQKFSYTPWTKEKIGLR